MNLTAELLSEADAWCARTGRSRARLATLLANDGKFFRRLEAGGNISVKVFERSMAWLATERTKAEQGTAASHTKEG